MGRKGERDGEIGGERMYSKYFIIRYDDYSLSSMASWGRGVYNSISVLRPAFTILILQSLQAIMQRQQWKFYIDYESRQGADAKFSRGYRRSKYILYTFEKNLRPQS